MNKRVLFVDWETFFDSKGGYGLKEISVTEYVRDSRFKPHGIGYQYLDQDKAHWVSGEHQLAAFIGSVDWANTTVVAHNVKFDGAILAWRYGVKPYLWVDTQALGKAALGEQVSSYSLRSLATYLGLPPKGELTCDGVLEPSAQQLAELGEYCKRDVELCKGIYEKLMPQFPQNQIWHMDWTIRAFVEPRLSLTENVLVAGVQKEKERREAAIKASGLDKRVLASNQQFARHLQSLGIEVRTKISGRTGKAIPAFAKTDEGLAVLQRSNPCLYAARIASKANLLETRGESLLRVARTGLFPFDVGFSGAVQTHRYSGGRGAGGNPQNFTRNSFLRDAVSAPEGHSLVVGDFAAIELRILAWLANEPQLIHKIINNEDVYSSFASLFYKRTVTKADLVERQFGKCAILGLGYGMGGDKFQATVKNQLKLDISDGDAYKTIRLYRTTYFNVPKLWQFAANVIPLIASDRIASLHFAPFIKVRKNALVLPSGLTIRYPNLRRVGDEWVYDVYRKKYESEPTKLYGGKLIENICQALAGELCKEAIGRLESEFKVPCVGQVHDEILAVMPTAAAFVAVEAMAEAMQQPPKWWPQIRLKSEVGYGPTWSTAKK